MASTSYNNRLVELIRKAESGVQKVIADAAGDGDYDAIEKARQIAIELKQLADGFTPTASDMVGDGTAAKKSLAVRRVDATEMPVKTNLNHVGSARRKPQRGGKVGYPRFEARNGTLYRIGWSKKQKKEYVHKVPRSSFDTIIDLLGRISVEFDTPVPAESVIDALDDDTRESIPTYQVYAVMMYLRQIDAIKQAGRDGYHIPADISQRKDTLWPS